MNVFNVFSTRPFTIEFPHHTQHELSVLPEGERKGTWNEEFERILNCNNKAIPFGYCLINTETAESFADLFRSFFDIMKAEPSVIITDEQAAIDSALQQLKR